jgi:hypothetical protein
MPKENDLDGQQDQGGKHGGQKDMPKPEPKPGHYPPQKVKHDEDGKKPTSRNNQGSGFLTTPICNSYGGFGLQEHTP